MPAAMKHMAQSLLIRAIDGLGNDGAFLALGEKQAPTLRIAFKEAADCRTSDIQPDKAAKRTMR